MDPARTKATELAVELLREPMNDLNLGNLLNVQDDGDFVDRTRVVAKRISQVVKAVSLEIETHIR